ncbi:hypothetical protein [Terracoccus sp. 273MFTsu3.1]|uniref:hypothetical protein n=1 Tax=Terracoccus sp. 273MFTsu3.1 TaxID=1172188 RepID=UPI000379F665|nr:hypothetical protein [Terracoccus sp. 273MFTsu3.1]
MKRMLAIDFGIPKPAPAREEEFDVTLFYDGFHLKRRVTAKTHFDALDVAHAAERAGDPAVPRLYRAGNASRVHGKAARQEAFA